MVCLFLHRLPELAAHTIGSRLVEQIVILADADMQKHIYERHLKGNIAHWALHPTANYIIQRLLAHVHSSQLVGYTIF